MSQVIITYDLNDEENYNIAKSRIEQAIMSLNSVPGSLLPMPTNAIKLTTTTWIVDTNKSLDYIHDRLRCVMDSNDELLVATVTDYRPNLFSVLGSVASF